MTTIKRQKEYLDRLNELNKEFGLAVKFDPSKGRYYLEDQVDYDYINIDCEIDSIDQSTSFKLSNSNYERN